MSKKPMNEIKTPVVAIRHVRYDDQFWLVDDEGRTFGQLFELTDDNNDRDVANRIALCLNQHDALVEMLAKHQQVSPEDGFPPYCPECKYACLLYTSPSPRDRS